MSAIDSFFENNAAYAARFPGKDIPTPPRRKAAIVTCMDARMDVVALLGLESGDAHILRNAGGVVTDDMIRSLMISQRLLGTREIMLIHHTQCGMLTFSDDTFREEIRKETGVRPPFTMEAFGDLDIDVRQSMARIQASPFVVHTEVLRGFVYDVATGRLREVE